MHLLAHLGARPDGIVEPIPGRHRITVGVDKAYDTKDFVSNMRSLGAAAHVTQNTSNPPEKT